MISKKKFETFHIKCCLVIWIIAILYSVYQFFLDTQNYFSVYLDKYQDFTEGWGFLSHWKRDKADFEWETMIYLINDLFLISIVYLVFLEILRSLNISVKAEQLFQILFTIFILISKAGYKLTALILLQPILFAVVNKLRRNHFVWLCNIFFLVLITIYKTISTGEEFQQYLKLKNNHEAHMITLALSWLNLKCTSYCLANNSSKTENSDQSLLSFVAYSLYFPTLFTGPFISFSDFNRKYNKKPSADGKLTQRLTRLFFNISRCFFWYLVINLLLHYIYVHAATFQVEMIKSLYLSSLCGYGYILGQFFHMKYIVFYGLSTSIASFDNVKVPNLPRCIARIHIYSDMWKYFDPGLYQFLKTCIFIPSKNRYHNKFLSSLLCFAFIYLWHGIEEYIFIWTVLNFLGVFIESILNNFIYNKLEDHCSKYLQRIKCIIAAPLLALSAVSNFYFFTGKDVGDIFMQRLFNESLSNTTLIMLVLYCCCEVSNELKDIDSLRIS